MNDAQQNSPVPARLKSVTQEDVARRCGVRRSTVSMAFSGDPSIPADTVARIRAAAAELGYDPSQNAAARRLIGRKYGRREINHLIALGFPRGFHRYAYWVQLFHGILDTLTDDGFGVVMAQLPSHLQLAPAAVLPVLKRGEVDGLITSAATIPFFLESGATPAMPLVSLLHPADVPVPVPCVMINEFTGAYLAMQHLLALGHHTVLHFSLTPEPDGTLWPKYRLAGARQALLDQGLPPEEHLFTLDNPWAWSAPLTPAATGIISSEEAEAQRVLAEFLAAHPQITAMMTINDAHAIRLFYHLKALGLRVPEDISIVGCDDVDPLLDEDRYNILTSIYMPLRETGQEAARLMLRLVHGEAAPDERVMLEPALSVRKTTGPARNS